jgi:hypothetical protein
MQKGLFNITEAGTTTLIDIKSSRGSLNSVKMTNTHSSTAVTVELFLEDAVARKAYIVVTDIPGKTSLVLNEGLGFDNFNLALKLKVNKGGLSTSTPLSVIMK